MARRLIVLAALLLVTACTTSRHHTFTGEIAPPAPNSAILIVNPDIELAVLTAAGLRQPRADWSAAARAEVSAQLAAHVAASDHVGRVFDPAPLMQGRTGQVIRLHEAVGNSILLFTYGAIALPTKKDQFDWTLGPGVRDLAEAAQARYALFVTGRGAYASGGRVAAMVGLSLLGIGVPLGGQRIFASLVDLQSGDVLWFNVANAGPNADMRDPEGARILIDELMDGAPL